MRLSLLIIASLCVSACVKTEKPVVQACRTPDGAEPAPSEASFTILPSRDPGVEITRASWRTRGGGDGFVNVENLRLSTSLSATRRVPQNEIVLAYDAPGPHAIVDAALMEEGSDQYHLPTRGTPFLDSGGQVTVGLERQLRSSWWIGRNSALTYCPRTVRLAPLSGLALTLAPELETPQGQAARLRTSKQTTPLAVIMDTVVDGGLEGGISVGAALNTTDSTLHDMVVGLVVVSTPDPHRPPDEDGAHPADTLEYLVGTIAPHALVPFGGGQLTGFERVTRRVVYHPTDVSGRAIADEAVWHRASDAARVTHLR